MKLIKTDVPCAYLNFFSSLLSLNLFIIGININCAKTKDIAKAKVI